MTTADIENALTKRQWEIARRFALRTPIKTIAAELGIAPSTVNDHLSTVKKKLGVTSNQKLAEALIVGKQGLGEEPDTPTIRGERFERVSGWPALSESVEQDTPTANVLNDSAPMDFSKAWSFEVREPEVVPEELDGTHAISARLMAIGKILLVILGAVILAMTALQAIDGAIDKVDPPSKI